ncbi:MAG TPA: class II aldolase/adducin family protein [Candidatus Sulfotelmatobacter sp.]|nr:class II aldolase/adducin family protein [Candidatus Sulfotelmatobacter sp.]
MSPTAAFKAKPLSVKDQVSAGEWDARVNLAAAYRLVALYGWDDLVFTHLSARVPGPDHHFLINPYGMMFEEITASSLVKIDLDGNIVMDTGYPVNKAGFVIHSAIHAARADALCVMHLHTRAGIAVSCQKQGLMPLNQTAMFVSSRLAYHDYEGIALDLDEQPRLVADLGDKSAMLLRNHGTLTVGRNVGDAFMRMYSLERACEIQIGALAGGTELNWPSEKAQETVKQQTSTREEGNNMPSLSALAWPALLRKLDRIDPSFRD